jgi:hypothetical protein
VMDRYYFLRVHGTGSLLITKAKMTVELRRMKLGISLDCWAIQLDSILCHLIIL